MFLTHAEAMLGQWTGIPVFSNLLYLVCVRMVLLGQLVVGLFNLLI